jgi:hypothetical protein
MATTTLPTEANITIEGAKTYLDWVQSASNGSFFLSILFGLFIILFVIFKGFSSNGKAFFGASFISMVICIMLSILGWISSGIMYGIIILTAIGLIWAYLEDKNE